MHFELLVSRLNLEVDHAFLLHSFDKMNFTVRKSMNKGGTSVFGLWLILTKGLLC